MTELGYTLSAEEHGPDALVRNAARAEEAGFDFASISDHYHPWTRRQGESPFVWSVLGGIAEATDELRIGTGVTCPTIRIHPAIIAQATATAATMLDGRFYLGVGTGELLNEHVTGEHWPEHAVRLDMLAEAVDIIRGLWEGEQYSHHGEHYDVQNARLFTLPDETPPINVAAAGPESAAAAGEFGDGLISTAADADVVEQFAGESDDRPRYAQFTVCWAEDVDEAVDTAMEWWPNVGLPGEQGQHLETPAHFEQACRLVDEDDVREAMALGPDPEEHIEGIREFVDAGFDHVYVHQVGPDQEGFVEFYEENVVPAFE